MANGGRIAVLVVALLAIGILVLPSTMTLFSGQHDWYDTAGKISCKKCHADIFDEIQNTAEHTTLMIGNTNDACYECHRVNASMSYAEGGGPINIGKYAHAASTVACMYCHDFSGTYGAAPAAGGFEQPSGSSFSYIDGTHPGGQAAHQQFVQASVDQDDMRDANEACIACHTHIKVNITWTHAHDLEFNATWTDTNWDGGDEHPPTHFNVTDWNVNGTYKTKSYGNGSGEGSTTGWP